VSPITVDRVCADAVDLARTAAVEEAGAACVGEHLGVEGEAERAVTHLFACLDRAYRGWRWAVTVVRAARARAATVAEVVLLPGAEALLPPAWLPWQQRLRPGDLGVGDVLPTPEGDPRLVPAAFDVPDWPAEELTEEEISIAAEYGLGRPRVLGAIGREEAAERWYRGDSGPKAPIARAAPLPCAGCGFYLPLGGPLRRLFGVCGNAYAPDDGRVVSADHGCGAHSEVTVAPGVAEPPPPLVDEFGFDPMPPAPPAPSVSDGDAAEALGHS
jgi:hypothetical protein